MTDFIFSVIFIFFALFGIFELAGSIFKLFTDRRSIEENTYVVTKVPNQNAEIYIRDYLNLFEDHENLVLVYDSDETKELLNLFQRTHLNLIIAEKFELGETK